MRIAAFLSGLLLTFIAFAQEAPVIKVTTRQVQVSVIVHDKKGKLVTDLTKDDFSLYDKGQEQKIGYFAKDAPRTAPYSGVVPGVVTNRPPAPAAGESPAIPATTVVLLDGINTRFQDRASAERALMQFLGGLKPGDPVGIYLLTDTLKFLRAGNPEVMRRYLDDFMTRSTSIVINFQRERVFTTLGALQTIAVNLAGIPGRKNLVWLTDGFPALSGLTGSGRPGRNYESFDEDIRRAVLALDHAEVAIYPVDARGMVSVVDMSPSNDASMPAMSRRRSRAMDGAAKTNIVNSEATMNDVAERTGGRAFMGSNDLSGFIQEAISDTRVTYTLAYSPTHNEWDGRFREIKLKVNRPGLEIRYRKGYFAYPEQITDATRAASLAAALDSPMDASGVGLMARLLDAPTKENPQTRMQFVVDIHDLSFHQDQGQWIADLDTTLLTRDNQGAELSRRVDPVHASLKQEDYDKAQKNGVISLTAKFETPAKATRVKLVVRDLATGLMGSVELPVGVSAGK